MWCPCWKRNWSLSGMNANTQDSKRLISEDRDILYIGQHRHLYHYNLFWGRFTICLFVMLSFMSKSCYCSLVPRSSNGFCRCFAFQIGKICYHHCIIRHFQFRKCLLVNSNCEIQKTSKIMEKYLINHEKHVKILSCELCFLAHSIIRLESGPETKRR